MSDPRPVILVVDDSRENLEVVGGLLRPDYDVREANSGALALQLACAPPLPDLILLDVMMPDMDGFSVLAELKADPLTRSIPVVFITAMDDAESQLRGFHLGAVDYIAKPIMPPVVLARARTQIELKQARDRLQADNRFLETEIGRRMAENELIQTVSIRALAHLAEIRDPETGFHIHRTQNYVRVLALALRDHPRFAPFLTERNIALLVKSAPLHDIGKVGIPDHILLKPGGLTPAEWKVMQTHAKLGSDAIELAEEDAEKRVAFLMLAKEIAHWHHERWDGSGYPDGLRGEEIPIAARLMAVADVFDALISPRIYKAAMSYDEANDIIEGGGGRHFDPDVTTAFLARFDEFTAIADRYREDAP